MPGLLKVNDSEEELLSFDLTELLVLVQDDGPTWKWRLLRMGEGFELYGDLTRIGTTVEELSQSVRNSDNGVPVSWVQLNAIAGELVQTELGTFAACTEASSFTGLLDHYLDGWLYVDRADSEYYARTEVVFQAVDFSYWLVYAKSDAILKRIAQAFRDVELLRTW